MKFTDVGGAGGTKTKSPATSPQRKGKGPQSDPAPGRSHSAFPLGNLPAQRGNTPSTGARKNSFGSTLQSRPVSQMYSGYARLTQSEADRRQLAVEIAHLEMLIERATNLEIRENLGDAFKEDAHSTSNSFRAPSQRPATSSSSQFNRAPKVRKVIDTSKLCEISTLQWPMLFGEACVLAPDTGLSRGTIVADTTCDLFLIHKSQMQTFNIDSKMLEKIKQKAVQYPDDTILVANLANKESWQKEKETIMDSLMYKIKNG